MPVTATRSFSAPPERIWTECTTERGLDSWWAPEGFVLDVEALELRSGGRVEFRYREAAAARDPTWRAELEARGQATSWAARGVFTAVEPNRRLAFQQDLDFGSRRPHQKYRFSLELCPEKTATKVSATAAAPASKHWTLLGRSNLVGQLKRLEQAVASSRD